MSRQNLEGKKPCIHKKTFFGMIAGRCVKCGGYLSSIGKNPPDIADTVYDDIKSILIMAAPYYESDDKDDYFYLVRKGNIEVMASNIYKYIKGREVNK